MSENMIRIQKATIHILTRRLEEAVAKVEELRVLLAKEDKFVYSICKHSDSMLMDYEDYMNGDEEE